MAQNRIASTTRYPIRSNTIADPPRPLNLSFLRSSATPCPARARVMLSGRTPILLLYDPASGLVRTSAPALHLTPSPCAKPT